MGMLHLVENLSDNDDLIDWLIVGGGIHGVHLAVRLLGEANVAPERLRIVDPGTRLLERWRRCTETVGMTHLRSPSVHHLDLNPWSLHKAAGEREYRERSLFAPPFDRPALEFFNTHCDRVIDDFGLRDLHIRARAVECSIDCNSVRVRLSTGRELVADKVILALGASEQPAWPEWAPEGNEHIHHIFEADFDGWPSLPEEVIVVGGGISAAQLALKLAAQEHRVHLVSRHGLREHQFDSDPGWLGPRLMNHFQRERDADCRRALITEARHRGSVPPDVHRALQHAMKTGGLWWHETEVAGFESIDGGARVSLGSGERIRADRVLLATGFDTTRPGGDMVDQLIANEALACAKCGYPIVDHHLAWHPQVYVSGPLAELELGPSSRNIHGARRAGDRLVKVANNGTSKTPLSA
ncbi:MAG: FAD/NAD(P)-binding protein [Myxococcota bacterium]|nr:hypothetical protein [Myxococcales bacterium]MEC7751205.1 FAD/NAD(P)-binding protein [Myxococcota bacterium]